MSDSHGLPDTPDRRALWLSVGGGTLSGLLFVWSDLRAALEHRPAPSAAQDPVGEAFSNLGSLFSLLVLPVAIPLLARRRPFLWVVLALTLDLAWSVADRLITHNWPGLQDDLASNGSDALVSLLALSAPISFVRYLLRRHHEHTAHVLLAQQQAMYAVPEAEEGVWPPPPARPLA